MRKILYSLFLGLLFCSSANAAINVSGHISKNTLWFITKDVYQLTGNLYIDPGVTLTLATGVTVRSDNYNLDIIVDGRLEANGATIELLGCNPPNAYYSDLNIRTGGNCS